jgi:hypothetical protein
LQESHFFVPADQRGQAARRDNVEPGLHPTLTQNPTPSSPLGHRTGQ